MGRETRSIHVSFSVSRHNSPRDVEDERLADDLRAAIEALCLQTRFESIGPLVH